MERNTRLAISAMRRILRSVEAQARSLMEGTGLTPSQLVLLQQLDLAAEVKVSDLAAKLGISQATTSVMAQKLQNRGLIHRRRGQTDRRQSWLSLSPSGAKALRAAPDSIQASFEREFSKLAEWEQLMMVSNLTRVADMLKAEEDAAPLIDSAPKLDHVLDPLRPTDTGG